MNLRTSMCAVSITVAAGLCSAGCVGGVDENSDSGLQLPSNSVDPHTSTTAPTALGAVNLAASATGGRFGRWYRDNYTSVRQQAREFWPNSFGCAAYASTALQMYGDASGNRAFSVEQVLLTNDVERQIRSLGWRSVYNMSSLQPGDVVLTDKSVSNVEGTWSHVYVFQGYVSAGVAQVSDNNGNLLQRNVGPGSRATSMLAYRAP